MLNLNKSFWLKGLNMLFLLILLIVTPWTIYKGIQFDRKINDVTPWVINCVTDGVHNGIHGGIHLNVPDQVFIFNNKKYVINRFDDDDKILRLQLNLEGFYYDQEVCRN